MRLTQLKSHCYTFPPDKSYFIKPKCKGISKTARFLHTIVYISNLIHTPKLPPLSEPLSWEFPSAARRLPPVSSGLPFPNRAREGEKHVGICQTHPCGSPCMVTPPEREPQGWGWGKGLHTRLISARLCSLKRLLWLT